MEHRAESAIRHIGPAWEAAHMSEFWLVTGAAAPIVALANLVAADEGMTSFYTFRKTRKGYSSARRRKKHSR